MNQNTKIHSFHCPHCTYLNNSDARECEMCCQNLTDYLRSNSILNSPSRNPNESILPSLNDNDHEQIAGNDDCSDNDEVLDLSQPHNKKVPCPATIDVLENDDDDEKMKEAMKQSDAQYRREVEQRRLEEERWQMAMNQSMISQSNNHADGDDSESDIELIPSPFSENRKNSSENESSLIDSKHKNLFLGFGDNQSRSKDVGIEIPTDCNPKKRRLNIGDDTVMQSMSKKQKLELESDDSEWTDDPKLKSLLESPLFRRNNNSNDNFKSNINANTNTNINDEDCDGDLDLKDYQINDHTENPMKNLDKRIVEKVEKSYIKFLQKYMKGAFCQRTVSIVFGPGVKGRSRAFDAVLSDTQWRPKSLAIPKNVAYDSCDDPDLPKMVIRFKFHRLKVNRAESVHLKFKDADKEGEIDKLKRMTINGMADYFLPRLLDKSNGILSDYVILRMDWKYFMKIWNEKKFDLILSTVKSLENVKTVNVILEGVEQEIGRIANRRVQSESRGENAAELKCPFTDQRHLKHCMMGYFLRDSTLHFTYTATPKQTADYIIRSARTLTDGRFHKLKENALTVSDHKKKTIASGQRMQKNPRDILGEILVAIKGVSGPKAAGIVSKYTNLGVLMKEYKSLSKEQGQLLLKDIDVPTRTNTIGPALSKKIYDNLWGNLSSDKMMNH